MAKGEEFSEYNNIVESFVSKNIESINYIASKERGRDMKRGVNVGEEEPNPYKIRHQAEYRVEQTDSSPIVHSLPRCTYQGC